MEGSRIEAPALGVAVVAGGLALTLIGGPLAWLGCGIGLLLPVILLAYDQEGRRNVFQSMAFSAVCGFGLAVATASLWQGVGETAALTGVTLTRYASERMVYTWLAATMILTIIDRVRVSSRGFTADVVPAEVKAPGAPMYSFAPPPAPPVSAPPVVVPVSSPVQAYTPSVSPPAPAPSEFTSTSSGIEPLSFGAPVEEPTTRQVSSPVSSLSAAIPVQGGKQATIFVGLAGEGLNMLRPVQAQQIRRDFYLIVEPMPEHESWQFQPGQIVRVQKRNLSTGKGLVAIEEAPKAS